VNSGPCTSKPLVAIHGLIILVVVAIPLRMIAAVDGLWFAPPAAAGPGACAYQVVQDGVCLGTVLMEEAAGLPQILRTVGATPPRTVDREGTTIPCNCMVRLKGNLVERVETISGRHLVCAGQRIDVNLANGKDLTALPGIGPALASRIVRYRDLHGPFNSPADLKRIPGIGKKRLAAITRFIEVKSVSSHPLALEHPGRLASASPSTWIVQKPGATPP